MEELDAPDDKVELRESKVPEIRLSKLRMEKQDKSPQSTVLPCGCPFGICRLFGFVRSGKISQSSVDASSRSSLPSFFLMVSSSTVIWCSVL